MSRIFLPNFRALDPVVRPLYEAFGLNDRQIQIIAHAAPKRDYYYESSVGHRLFDLALGPTALALCGAGSPCDQRLINSVLSEGRQGQFAEAFLAAKGRQAEADKIAGCRREMADFLGDAA
jgi:type IV secretion system protein VirB4